MYTHKHTINFVYFCISLYTSYLWWRVLNLLGQRFIGFSYLDFPTNEHLFSFVFLSVSRIILIFLFFALDYKIKAILNVSHPFETKLNIVFILLPIPLSFIMLNFISEYQPLIHAFFTSVLFISLVLYFYLLYKLLLTYHIVKRENDLFI